MKHISDGVFLWIFNFLFEVNEHYVLTPTTFKAKKRYRWKKWRFDMLMAISSITSLL